MEKTECPCCDDGLDEDLVAEFGVRAEMERHLLEDHDHRDLIEFALNVLEERRMVKEAIDKVKADHEPLFTKEEVALLLEWLDTSDDAELSHVEIPLELMEKLRKLVAMWKED